MHKKYFFFDIDGTLSTGLTTMMPESAVKALAQLRANGHFTAIATGRLQASAAAVGVAAGGRLHCADRATRAGRYSVGGVAGE